MSGFYRGLDANVMRAMVLNGTKMGCYDQIKGMIVKSGLVPNGSYVCRVVFTSSVRTVIRFVNQFHVSLHMIITSLCCSTVR